MHEAKKSIEANGAIREKIKNKLTIHGNHLHLSVGNPRKIKEYSPSGLRPPPSREDNKCLLLHNYVPLSDLLAECKEKQGVEKT
jgi:hypothetical protein